MQAVVEQGGKFYCWVQTLTGPQRRPVLLGMTNDKVIEIKDGVAEGDAVFPHLVGERVGDLVVAHLVDLTEHDDRALIERQLVERTPHYRGGFLLAERPIRRRSAARIGQIAVGFHMHVERHLLAAMTPPPPALPVRRLIDDDPVDPGL